MTKTNPSAKSKLEEVIDQTLDDIRQYPPGSEEYEASVNTLIKIYEVKAQDKPNRVSPDTLATVAANLLGIAIIVGYERMNIMTSKAMNFVTRLH